MGCSVLQLNIWGYSVCLDDFSSENGTKWKSTPKAPKKWEMDSSQMVRMEKSICHKWVYIVIIPMKMSISSFVEFQAEVPNFPASMPMPLFNSKMANPDYPHLTPIPLGLVLRWKKHTKDKQNYFNSSTCFEMCHIANNN